MDKTTTRVRGTTPGLQAAARELRKNLTPVEPRLWTALKGRQVNGLRFRQRHPVGPFVDDFYCPACRLVIEVDGAVHDEQVDQDAYRNQHLAAYGYRTLRFRNANVMKSPPSVLARIVAAADAMGCLPRETPRRQRKGAPKPTP